MEAETRYFIVEGKRLTEDEYYDLPVATRARYWLAGTRQLAGWLGYWRDCRLPACRRAKACRGEVRPEDGVEERDTAFPPCAHGNERRRNQIINTGIEMNRQAAQAAAKKA